MSLQCIRGKFTEGQVCMQSVLIRVCIPVAVCMLCNSYNRIQRQNYSTIFERSTNQPTNHPTGPRLIKATGMIFLSSRPTSLCKQPTGVALLEVLDGTKDSDCMRKAEEYWMRGYYRHDAITNFPSDAFRFQKCSIFLVTKILAIQAGVPNSILGCGVFVLFCLVSNFNAIGVGTDCPFCMFLIECHRCRH